MLSVASISTTFTFFQNRSFPKILGRFQFAILPSELEFCNRPSSSGQITPQSRPHNFGNRRAANLLVIVTDTVGHKTSVTATGKFDIEAVFDRTGTKVGYRTAPEKASSSPSVCSP